MTLQRYGQRAQFIRMKKEDEKIKEAYAESIQRDASWINTINEWESPCSTLLKNGTTAAPSK